MSTSEKSLDKAGVDNYNNTRNDLKGGSTMSYTRTKERWLVYLPRHQFEALTQLAKEVKGIKGSEMIVDAIEHHIIQNLPKFKASLKLMKYKNQLQVINDKKAAILEEERQLKKVLEEKEPEKEAVA